MTIPAGPPPVENSEASGAQSQAAEGAPNPKRPYLSAIERRGASFGKRVRAVLEHGPLKATPARWAAIVAILIAGGAAIAPWTVSRDALREDIAGQLRSSTGLYVFMRGRATIAALPRPHVRLENVAFVDPNGALVVEADILQGELRLLPLLAGRLEVAETTLVRPQVTIDIDRQPMSTAGAVVRAAQARAASPEADKADAARLGILSFVDGSATLRRGGAPLTTISHIDATLDWRKVADPATLSAEVTWNGERDIFAVWISRPTALLRGDQTPLTFEAKGREFSISTTGKGSLAPRARYEGRVVAATASLQHIARLAGSGIALPAVLSTISLDGNLMATPVSASLSGLHLHVGDEDFEGSLACSASGGSTLLSGTLATNELSLSPYLSELPVMFGSDGRFSSDIIDWHDASLLDLDLRLSASHMRYGRLHADDAALSLMSNNGRMTFSIADARAYNGTMKARATISPSATQPGMFDTQTSLQMRGVDWGAIDWELGGDQRLTGNADVALSLEGAGESFQKIAHDLHGQGQVSMTSGEIGGLDVPGSLARIGKRPLSVASDLGTGRTPFESATFGIDVRSGIAAISRGLISGSGYSIDIGGEIRIPDRALDLKAKVASDKAKSGGAENAGFAFDVTGPWSHPSLVPDVQGMIRRSGAASPLFPPQPKPPAGEPVH